MGRYIDGFILPLAKDRVDDYRKMAEFASGIWKEHGALDYWECLADDTDAPEMVSFLKLAGAGPDETVVFAWAMFESREKRDEANAKIMADERLKDMMKEGDMVFDCKRMAYGGFTELVHA